jgi:hypothetical protein
VIAKQMYGARCPRDIRATPARRLHNTLRERHENVARTLRGRRAALAHTFCVMRTHFVVRIPFPHAQQMPTIKKKTLWIFTHMIYKEFFVGFFFADLVEWRKDVVCTFSHIIRLTPYHTSMFTIKTFLLINITFSVCGLPSIDRFF